MDKPCHLAAVCAIRRLTGSESITLYPKRRGELVELIFTLKAATMGLAVSKPLGDSLPYDVVIESGHRMLRIQVKSSFSRGPGGNIINIGRGGNQPGKRIYTPDEIDFLVAFIVCYDVWYIIPATALGTLKGVKVYPEGTSKKSMNRFEDFRDAWHLITGVEPPEPPGAGPA